MNETEQPYAGCCPVDRMESEVTNSRESSESGESPRSLFRLNEPSCLGDLIEDPKDASTEQEGASDEDAGVAD